MSQNETSEGKESAQLSPKEAKFIASLLEHATLSAACEACGISRMTGYRFLDRPAVKQAYKEALDKAIGLSQAQLLQLHETSVAVVASILTNEEAPPGVRLRAATVVIEAAHPLNDLKELQQKVDEMSAKLQENGVFIKNGRLKPSYLSGYTPQNSKNGTAPGADSGTI